MKKFTSFLLILFFSVILIGCEKHTHSYTETVTAPTCIDKGYTTYTCSCGESYKDNEVEALGHSYGEWTVTKEATETEKGSKERKCVRCEDTQTEEIPMLTHTHSYTETVTAPTCIDKGYTTYTCSCGESYKDNEVEALGHSYGEWTVTKEATETEKGSKERKCVRCEDTQTEEIPMLTHTHSYTEEVTVPTCIDKGYTTYTCSCGHSYQGNEVEALGHSYGEWTVVKVATETEKGSKERKCSRCEDIQTEEIPMLTHTHSYTEEVTAPTCINKGYTTYTCSCGHSYQGNEVEALGHSYGEWTVVKEATETEKGLKERKCSKCEDIQTEEISAKKYVDVNITLDTNGGIISEVDMSFNLSYYLKYDVAGKYAALNDSAKATYWKYILLKETYTKGIYQIVDIVYQNVNVTASYDLLIMWHSDLLDTTAKEKLDSMYSNSKNYLGRKVSFLNLPSSASSSADFTVQVFKNITTKNDVYNDPQSFPDVIKDGYTFLGWKCSLDNKIYQSYPGYYESQNITYTAEWQFDGKIVGEFKDNSWVVKGKTIDLLITYIGSDQRTIKWTSKDTSIATVSQDGIVKGVSEGVATIVVSDSLNSNIFFTFYVTVLNEEPTGVVKLLVDSNNESIYTRNNLLIGLTYGKEGAYYADIVGSVSKLLFTDYTVHNDYYLSSPKNKTTLSGVDFITVHYAADMPYSAKYSLTGGKNLASLNQNYNNSTSATSSWHYSVGNDGIWACQNESYGANHAGSSKTMTWKKTNILYKDTDPEFAKITLESDNYFYLNGKNTNIKNTTNGTKLNGMGLAFKVGSDGYYYLGGFYYNSTYGYLSSTGGNNNSISMETSVRDGSDLWLTWQYASQLCAKLLLKYDLPLTRLVGHHFFSGKWCPQPMLENDLEIWWEFVELVRQEMDYYKNYSNYTLQFSSSSEYLKTNGRISSLPSYSQCVTYDVTYTSGNISKTITLSSIIPGTEA